MAGGLQKGKVKVNIHVSNKECINTKWDSQILNGIFQHAIVNGDYVMQNITMAYNNSKSQD